jgi:hypothetical protein
MLPGVSFQRAARRGFFHHDTWIARYRSFRAKDRAAKLGAVVKLDKNLAADMLLICQSESLPVWLEPL